MAIDHAIMAIALSEYILLHLTLVTQTEDKSSHADQSTFLAMGLSTEILRNLSLIHGILAKIYHRWELDEIQRIFFIQSSRRDFRDKIFY